MSAMASMKLLSSRELTVGGVVREIETVDVESN